MDYIKEDFINILHISSNNMLADVLTKKINKESFNYFIDNTFYFLILYNQKRFYFEGRVLDFQKFFLFNLKNFCTNV